MMEGKARHGEWLAVAFWAALGTAIAVAAWRMDRLDHLGIAPWSAPGVLPGFVGVLMVMLAVALALRLRSGARAQPQPAAGHLRASALAAVLCFAFAGLALGRGWPFQLEAAVFVFVFTAAFGAATWRAQGRVARGVATALAVAVVAAFGIGALFEQVFLVRLP
ncbi:MAG: tripartite tricarboxylate transporter TctB family protein [Rubrivivax sp.]|nr:tripartite tricarboxylate transporter TctB family protein [Rubrivivax sp.]